MRNHKDRAGVMAIRIWVERSLHPELRARITSTTDLEGNGRDLSAASSIDEIEETVHRWVRSFVEEVGAEA